jgi:histidinol dehydrogenase
MQKKKHKHIVNEKAPRPPKGGGQPAVINSADKILYAKLKDKAEEMRNNPTETEEIMWEVLQDKKLGVKFRRQHIIDKFIVDFYCVEKALSC